MEGLKKFLRSRIFLILVTVGGCLLVQKIPFANIWQGIKNFFNVKVWLYISLTLNLIFLISYIRRELKELKTPSRLKKAWEAFTKEEEIEIKNYEKIKKEETEEIEEIEEEEKAWEGISDQEMDMLIGKQIKEKNKKKETTKEKEKKKEVTDEELYQQMQKILDNGIQNLKNLN